MKTKHVMESIDVKVSKGRQDLRYLEILKMGGKKFRISIRSDSYDFQCHAKISIWNSDKDEWNLVYSIPYSEMKTESKLYYICKSKKIDLKSYSAKSKFKEDREELIRLADEIVFF